MTIHVVHVLLVICWLWAVISRCHCKIQ